MPSSVTDEGLNISSLPSRSAVVRCILPTEGSQPEPAARGSLGLVRPMGRSQSAVELHSLGDFHRVGSASDLRHLEQVLCAAQ